MINTQFFDASGNKTGTAADRLRNAADLLNLPATQVGDVNIFGDVATAESIAAEQAVLDSRIRHLVKSAGF